MTTAHRPTFDTARGGGGRNEGDLSKLSKQYSSKDMPSHTKIKYRQPGQSTSEDNKEKDFRRELEDRERTGRDSRRSRHGGPEAKKVRLEALPATTLDADEPVDADDDSDDDDEEDDTAELMAELSRIKAERAAEKAEKAAEVEAEEEKIRMDNILHGNPLLQSDKPADFKVSRRWDDDVVFKNCAKGQHERAKDPSFVNDAIRGEFHKKFMERYIK